VKREQPLQYLRQRQATHEKSGERGESSYERDQTSGEEKKGQGLKRGEDGVLSWCRLGRCSWGSFYGWGGAPDPLRRENSPSSFDNLSKREGGTTLPPRSRGPGIPLPKKNRDHPVNFEKDCSPTQQRGGGKVLKKRLLALPQKITRLLPHGKRSERGGEDAQKKSESIRGGAEWQEGEG